MVQRPHNSLDKHPPFSYGKETNSSQDQGEERTRIAELEAEREQLKSHLKSAEHRIHELELTQASVVNRINSLIGSLGSALDESA